MLETRAKKQKRLSTSCLPATVLLMYSGAVGQLESTAVKHVLPTREYATRKYADKLISEIDDAIHKNIGTADPIVVGVTNYNKTVVNEVIESLKNSGWEVHGIYGGGLDGMAAITLS
jgi:hypothetical protein